MTKDEKANFWLDLMNLNPDNEPVTIEECYKFVDLWEVKLKKHKKVAEAMPLPEGFVFND